MGTTDVSYVEASSRRSRYETVGLVVGFFLLSTAAAAYEIAPASVLPLVRTSMGIDASAAGWLMSVMYATAVVASVPVGIALDRVSVRRAMTVGGIALVVAGVWGWFAAAAGAYWWLLVSRVLGGIAYVLFWNAGANTIGRAVGPDVRATAVGIFTASAPVGFALGQFGSPLLARPFGWPTILPAFAAIAVVGLGIFLLATHGRSIDVEADSPDRDGFVRLFTDTAVWTLCACCFLAYSLYLFLNTWLPSFMVEQFGVPLAVGGVLTALFPAIGVVSRSSSGALSDRVFGRRRRPVTVAAFAIATPAVVAFAVVSRVAVLVVVLVVSGFAVQLAIGLLFSYVTEVVAAEVRTTAVSLLTSVGLFGAFVAPIAAGRIIDGVGYTPAFVLAGGVALLGVVLAWHAPESDG
ncbi:MFS transporter [Halococcus saccharolyticus]|uniref:MFS transporter n=1 Tax=Halococcus saccharolyticus TaxID=62319 RepID=UPI00373AF039